MNIPPTNHVGASSQLPAIFDHCINIFFAEWDQRSNYDAVDHIMPGSYFEYFGKIIIFVFKLKNLDMDDHIKDSKP